MTEAIALCPRCDKSGTWSAPGLLAGHLVERHGIGASTALVEARRLFVRPAPASPTAAVVARPVDPQEEPMRKRKPNKCSTCGTAGHKATTCPKTTTGTARSPARAKGRKAGIVKPTRRALAIAGASAPAADEDLLANARQKAGDLVRQKLQEELAWAEAYVAELKRVGGLA